MEQTIAAPVPAAELTADDVETCVRVLRAIEADRSHLTRLDREKRRELLTLAGLVAKPERRDLVRMAKAFRRAERDAAKAHDRDLIERAALRLQRKSSVYAPLKLEPPKPEDLDERAALKHERACYVCKQPFAKVHRYYDSMCELCGDFNYAKRELTADLDGHYALVTGARVKIGYQAALKLLRAGASRHRHDALPGRRREPLRAGARLRRVPRASADLRGRPAPHAERRAARAVPRRAAAAPRPHSQQRVPNRAPAAGVLSPLARARDRRRSARCPRPRGACSRSRASCTRCWPARASAAAPLCWLAASRKAKAWSAAPSSRSAATSMKTCARARSCFRGSATTRISSRSICAR